MQPCDQYFEHGDARLRFRDEGHGVPLMFIHGWTLDLEMWQPQADELSRLFRVIRFDRRGFGLSSGSPSLADDVSDLCGLMDHLQLAQVVMIGMSQGARVALSFAMSTPQRVAALVLDGAPSLVAASDTGADEDLPLARYHELVRTDGMDAFRTEWQNHSFVRLWSGDAGISELLARIIARYPGRDLREFAQQSAERIDVASLATLRRPALVLNGELDTDTRRRAGDALSSALPLVERALVPNAGHLANLDNPRIYNDIIHQFLVRRVRIAA